MNSRSSPDHIPGYNNRFSHCEEPFFMLDMIMKALEKEKKAIESIRPENLAGISDEIDILLKKFAEVLSTGRQLPREAADLLEQKIKALRLQREANRALAERTIHQIKTSIKTGSTHRRAIKAYHPSQLKNELLVKKEC